MLLYAWARLGRAAWSELEVVAVQWACPSTFPAVRMGKGAVCSGPACRTAGAVGAPAKLSRPVDLASSPSTEPRR